MSKSKVRMLLPAWSGEDEVEIVEIVIGINIAGRTCSETRIITAEHALGRVDQVNCKPFAMQTYQQLV